MISKEAPVEYAKMLALVSVHVLIVDDPDMSPVQTIQVTASQPSYHGPRLAVDKFHTCYSIVMSTGG